MNTNTNNNNFPQQQPPVFVQQPNNGGGFYQPQQFGGQNLPYMIHPGMIPVQQNGQHMYPMMINAQTHQPMMMQPPFVEHNIQQDHLANSSPLENSLNQLHQQSSTVACRYSGCTRKLCTFVKENRLLSANIALFSIISIMSLACLIEVLYVAFLLFPKFILGLLAIIAAVKKRGMALNFFNGCLLIDFLYLSISSIMVSIAQSASSHSGSYYRYTTLSLPYQIIFQILQAVFVAISMYLSVKIYREANSARIIQDAGENVVPIIESFPATNNNTASSSNDQYARLNEEQEEGRSASEQVTQRYYPSLNNNNN